MIALTKIASSNIDAIGHHVDTLYVRFTSGATYQYEGVPRAVYEDMLGAESVGRFFGTYIRPNYSGVKVDLDEKKEAA